jgi:tetratricopeptide (TPR) repeat protein
VANRRRVAGNSFGRRDAGRGVRIFFNNERVIMKKRMRLVFVQFSQIMAGFILAIFVLFSFTFFCTKGLCDNNSESNESHKKNESVTQYQGNLSASQEADIATWNLEIRRLMEDGKIDEAVSVEKKKYALLDGAIGKDHWRAKNEEACLAELISASKLPQQKQKIYLVAYNGIYTAGTLIELGDYDRAEELLNNTLKSLTDVLGGKTISVICVLEQVGNLNFQKGNFKKTKEYAIREISLTKAIISNDVPHLAMVLYVAGYACFELGEIDQSESYFRDSLTLERKIHGIRSYNYAMMEEGLSRVMIEKKKWPEAEVMCMHAIAVAEERQLFNSRLMADCLYDLANINIAYDDYKAADSNLRQTLLLCERNLQPGSSLTIKVMRRYVFVLQKENKSEEAIAMGDRADAMIARRDSHPANPPKKPRG